MHSVTPIANVVAHAMKEWALEHGATHYTHWFHPMTGVTAEKHDSFCKYLSLSTRKYSCSGPTEHETFLTSSYPKSLSTRHNEVAPAQHEMAPIFATANISTDHNQLTKPVVIAWV